MNSSDQISVDTVARHYTNRSGDFNTLLARIGYELIKPYCVAGSVLEVGPADGEMTAHLVRDFTSISIVEPSRRFISLLTKQFPTIIAHNAFLETFKSTQTYDNIIIAHVLEHVVDPHLALLNARKHLNPNGRIFLVVPNAMSLHRQVGVYMGLLKKTTDLNPLDKKQGHRRVYTMQTFREDITKARLSILHLGGFFLKQQPSSFIEKHWSAELIKGYFQLGQLYPTIASELFAVCQL